jgi:glutathione-regulated potassium-efflux system ancillary protein KefC
LPFLDSGLGSTLEAAPAAFLCFLVVKIAAKIVGVYPVTKFFGSPNQEAMYTTLLMSTGLTFGTISSLFGLSHGTIDQGQYSALVAAVIGSAVIPTVIANAFYVPRHLLPEAEPGRTQEAAAVPLRKISRGAE